MTPDRSLTDLTSVIRIHGRHRPSKPAIVEGGRAIDYATLDAAVDALAHRLARAGIGRGQTVGACLSDSALHLVALLALARMGAIILPMDRRWTGEEKLTMAGHFGADRVLCDGEASCLAANWIGIEEDWPERAGPAYVDDLVGHDTPLLLSLSSGTTGAPTGPLLTHRQFENRFMAYWIDLGLSGDERFVSATPLYFGGGRGFCLGLLHAGATVFMFPPPYKPEELLAHVRSVGASALFLVPTLLRRLLQIEDADISLPSLSVLISSGSALFPEERQAIARRISPNLRQFYSSTEGGAVTVLRQHEAPPDSDTVGRPCFRVEVEVVDGNHRPLPAGEIGLLRYRSPASPAGFHLGDSANAFREGWFYPGDMAMLDEQGFLHLRGRSKDMIIRGGVNIYPGDIERVLLSMPRIADAAVIGVPDAEMGEKVAAYIVAEQPVEEAAVIIYCRTRLASFKVPSILRFVDELPKGNGGKVVKRKLLEAYVGEVGER